MSSNQVVKKEEEEVEGEEVEVDEIVKRPDTFEEYEKILKNQKKTIILYVSSKFCSPCEDYVEKFPEFAKRYHKNTFIEVEFENKFFFKLFKEFRLTCVPSFAFIEEGRLKQTLIGSTPLVLERRIRQEIGIRNSQWAGLDEKWEYPEESEEEEEVEAEEAEAEEEVATEVRKKAGGDPGVQAPVGITGEYAEKKEDGKPQNVVRIQRKMVKGREAKLGSRKRSIIDPTGKGGRPTRPSRNPQKGVVKAGGSSDGVVLKFGGGARGKGKTKWVVGEDGKMKKSNQ